MQVIRNISKITLSWLCAVQWEASPIRLSHGETEDKPNN